MKSGQEQRLTILRALRRRGSLTTDTLVEVTGRSKTATRAHLLRLQEEGLIARDPTAEHATLGRPPVTYRLTERGAAAFPSHDDAVLEGLVRFLAREGAQPLLERYFEEVWQRRSDELGPLGASLDERVERLKALLTAGDFMPETEIVRRDRGGHRVRVRECNCPLPATIRATRIPCRFEARFLAEALGGRVASVHTASDRAGTCLFQIDVEPEPSAGR